MLGFVFAGHRGGENMSASTDDKASLRTDGHWFLVCFLLAFGFHFWGMTVGWQSKNLPGNEFRQTQTAISSYWIEANDDFSLAYPTPILGKPWSIPMEFPLYQWTTVMVHRTSNWSLTKSGRAVSIGCFYLTLPAVFLALRRWRVAPAHRWAVLAVIVTCPFYIYFTRGVLIETMALMFSWWFWVAFERAVTDRSKAWLMVAMVAGAGAGLVKVTTYLLYLLPAAVWACNRLWRNRRGEWRVDLGWMSAAVALPFAVTLWWLHFADATKAENPLATFIVSDNLTEFNLGTNATRFSGEMWLTKLHMVAQNVTWLPLLIVGGLLMAGPARRRWREICACVGWFASVLLLFPVLYALHDYYYAANAMLLLTAVGLVVVALIESPVASGIKVSLLAIVLLSQGWRYVEYYYPSQSAVSIGGDGLTRSLQAVTRPEDVIVVWGQDWSSITPYYARRKAVMLRDDVAQDTAQVEAALRNIADEKIGAVVISGDRSGADNLIALFSQYGVGRRPTYLCNGTKVFLPPEREPDAVKALLTQPQAGVTIAPGVDVPRRNLADRWVDFADLWPWEKTPFQAMEPKPMRFYSQFGPNADGSSGVLQFGAHPVTRLVFSLPAGRRILRSSLQMKLDAYRSDLSDSDATDGVDVSLYAIASDGSRQLLASRFFNPRTIREDRGELRPLEFVFSLERAGEVELDFTPGPESNLTRDWIELGPLQID